MISFLIEWISWIIYLNKNYTYIHTYLYIKLYIHTYLYIIWKRKFYFLLTTLYYTTWLYKFMLHIHLKTLNSYHFSIGTFSVYMHFFIQLAHFWSMGTFSFKMHIFHSIGIFPVNKHLLIYLIWKVITFQYAPFGISNLKSYDLSIGTFRYIYYNISYIYLYIYIYITQIKLETQYSFLFLLTKN